MRAVHDCRIYESGSRWVIEAPCPACGASVSALFAPETKRLTCACGRSFEAEALRVVFGGDEGGDDARRDLVLVIDDDTDTREVLADVLQGEGYVVATACHGAHALALIAELPTLPSAIVVDLMMPEMDGLEFRRRQLDDPRLAAIPVILMSAVVPSADVRRRLDALRLALISKPVDIDEIIEALREAVARRRTSSSPGAVAADSA